MLGKHKYSGAKTLTEYSITRYSMTNIDKVVMEMSRSSMFVTKAGSLEVEVEMGRQILGIVLTMYLPTSLMNVIGMKQDFE